VERPGGRKSRAFTCSRDARRRSAAMRLARRAPELFKECSEVLLG